MAKTTPTPLDAKIAALDDLDTAGRVDVTEPDSAPDSAPDPAPTPHTRDRDPADRLAWKRERAIALGILKP